jgi:hypothetical protein
VGLFGFEGWLDQFVDCAGVDREHVEWDFPGAGIQRLDHRLPCAPMMTLSSRVLESSRVFGRQSSASDGSADRVTSP